MRLSAFNRSQNRSAKSRRSRMLGRFMRREDGTITTFALIIFVLMVAVGGIAVDIMRYETQRAQLQYTLDRAVLAAAAVTQPLDPTNVVENYFEVSGLENYRLEVTVEDQLNSRTVSAQAELEIDTLFMNMFGVRVLTSPAVGTAQEIIPNVEISLVLDISGTMRFENPSRIERLRPAARNFMTRVLEGNRVETTTISVVPYAGQVNPGAEMFDLMGGQRAYIDAYDSDGQPVLDGDGNQVLQRRDHPRSHCVEIDAVDFAQPSIPQGATFSQVPHFMNWTIDNPTMEWGWCPLAADGATVHDASIMYMSNNETALHTYIDNLRLHDGTGTHYGMLWGLWLLDPGSNWAIQGLNAAGIVHDDFADRPAAHNDPQTLKVIVLMTDGRITDQLRPRYMDRTQSPIDARDEDDIFLNHTQELRDQSRNSDCNGNNCYREFTSQSDNVDSFYSVCNRAKAENVIVFTIAFDLSPSDSGWRQMFDCASSEAHFYDVDGEGLDSAFQSIAGAINKLRLIQ
jgi:hypothetical protein